MIKSREIIEVDGYFSSGNIIQELPINHIPVSNHFPKTGFKKQLADWVTPINTKKKTRWIEFLSANPWPNRMKPIPFLKGWWWKMSHIQSLRKRWQSKRDQGAQTVVVKPGLTVYKGLLCFCWNTNDQTPNSDFYRQ